MKKILLMVSIVGAAIAYTPLVKAEDSMSLRICEYVSVNDKKRLRSFFKKNKMKLRSVFDSIKCNGQNLLVFSASSNALDVGEYIITKLPVKTVAANVDAIAKHSAHLQAAANKRIN
jgi:hypothetical protein